MPSLDYAHGGFRLYRDFSAPSKPNTGISLQNGANDDSQPARAIAHVAVWNRDSIGDYDETPHAPTPDHPPRSLRTQLAEMWRFALMPSLRHAEATLDRNPSAGVDHDKIKGRGHDVSA